MWLSRSKILCLLTAAMLSVGAKPMARQDSEQAIERFEAGQRLGDCLLKGCVVFTGIIESLGELEKEPGVADENRAVMTRGVDLKVIEWLYGKGDRDSVQLLYAERPALSKTGLGPWLAWEGVKLDLGHELLVVRWAMEAPRPSWLGKPEDVAFVVSDKGLFDPVRAAIAQHRRFERDPGEAAKIPQLLRDTHDSLLKGYLLSYLMDGEGVHNVDHAAAMLGGILGHSSIPEPAQEAVADWLASTFYRLAEPTRQATTETLVKSASADDTSVAYPALTVLIQLGDQHLLHMKPFLNRARQQKIAQNYRAYKTQNKVQQAHAEFESQLGFKED